MSENRQDRERELHDFWDIGSLVPQKKKPPIRSVSPRPAHVDTVEIELDAPKQTNTINDVRLTATPPVRQESDKPTQPDTVYHPHHPLIREVRLRPWRSSFHFYERFCATAARLFDLKGEPCERVSFFSYMPQYDQMNRAQLGWYLYWRDRVRMGEYLDTDYSYIFLYLFEIINLPDRIPPKEGQKLLCRIWKRYREEYPLLNRYLADWICDYSLIHQLPPPVDELAGELRTIAEQSSFKEFYACPTGNDATGDAQLYLLFCTNYDYHKSKLYLAGPDRAEAMDTHIPSALSTVLQSLEQQGQMLAGTKMQKARLSRDSFVGALCSGEMKRRIEVDHCSFHRSHELRFLITDIIKYSENKLRTSFGVKSKLSVYALPDKIKAILDDYFTKVMPSRRTVTLENTRPEYEALYDLPKSELSFEHAAEIEQASWSVTKQLVEAFEDATTVPPETFEKASESVVSQPVTEQTHQTEASDPVAEAFVPYRAFLVAVIQENAAAQRQFARDRGLLIDAVADEINSVAADVLGDIILEDHGNGYVVIEDYLEDVKRIL